MGRSSEKRSPDKCTAPATVDSPPIRVLHIIDHLGLGGAQTLLFDLATTLAKRGRYRASICCLGSPTGLSHEIWAAGTPLTHLNARQESRIQLLFTFPRLISIIRKEKVALIHTHLFASNTLGRVAGMLLGLPVVIHEQQNETKVLPIHKKLVDRALASKAAAIIAVSDSTRAFNIRVKGVDPDKIHTVPNAINLERLRLEAVHRQQMRKSLNLPPSAPLVIGVGRLAQQKRFDLWLEAAAGVHQQVPDAQFLLVGDGPLRHELETQAESLELEQVVRFLGAREDVPQLLGASDLFVLSSDYEGLPLALLEALAMGLPAIATAADGSAEVLQGTSAGRLVPTCNVSLLTSTIVDLLQNPQTAQALGSAGRDLVEARYSAEGMAEAVESVYAQVLAK
jgi:glycosyltransferase involved in cell wall biosynthesis